MDIDGTLKLWPGGTVALDGGTLETASMQLAGGAFNWTTGALHLGSGLSVDPSGLLGGSVALGAGKDLVTDGKLDVGNAGNGTLSLTNGAFVRSAGGRVAVDGTVVINGSTWETFRSGFDGDFSVSGTLEIVNGGSLRTSHAIGQFANLSVDGQLTINQGSVFIRDVPIADGGQLWVNGRIQIEAGDLSNQSEGYIGNGGIINVDGPDSLWNCGDNLHLGDIVGGIGELHVSNGGRVSTGLEAGGHGFIGGSGQYGIATIDGMGSEWRLVDEVRIVNGLLTVSNDGTVSCDTFVIYAGGEIRGDGNIVGNVENGGLVSPGTSPGALNLNGNYTQMAGGELLIELASASSYDQLLTTETATLGDKLTVNLLDGFVPSPGQSFTIFTADDIDGTFATEMLPFVPGLIFDVIYNPQSVVLTVLPAFTADFDEDGDVDAADLAQWQGDFGVNALSDADDDGDSDGDDFLQWQRQLGSPLPATAAADAVPEPGSAALVSAALFSVLARQRRVGARTHL